VAGRIDALRAAGAHVFVVGDGRDGCREAPDRVARTLAERGVTGRLILVIGDDFGPAARESGRDTRFLMPELARAVVVSVGTEAAGLPAGVMRTPGGAARVLALVDAQLQRRRDRRVPEIDDDPAWIVVLPAEPAMERAAEALGTLSNGWAGSRASREEDGPGTLPLFVVHGVYGGAPEWRLLAGPTWTGMNVRGARPDERMVDLRTGVLRRTGRGPSQLRTLRFASAARPEALGLRAEGSPAHLDPGDPLLAPGERVDLERLDRGDVRVARTASPTGGGIAVAVRDRTADAGERRVIERLAAWEAHAVGAPDWDRAAARLTDLEEAGFDRLLAEHREEWARRWACAELAIDGSPADELAARFATFHLLGAAPDAGEAAVGARGLTGPAYGGHVFWDADVFVLPAVAAIRPAAARAMLEYRIRRLPAARAAAAELGLRGARFPWESAGDGRDVTPRRVQGVHGEVIPIVTGEKEEHIVADVAWAASEYAAWTGDVELLTGPGRDLILDTARYWAGRIRMGPDGRGHLYGVMGPDEYHEVVDDNAYTNVMARWNLRRAAELTDDEHERERWLTLAAKLIDGWDPKRRLYEQFAGYFGLEPLRMTDIAPPPVAADVVLGRQRVEGSQLIKQADVLMLQHLVPDEVMTGSLAANLDYYEPRTAHGSSLSPAIHAVLFARAGQPERALELFRLASRLDLDDLTGTTAGGLHLATMGGVWQALTYGFLGLRPRGDALDVDPCLPAAWRALSVRLCFRSRPITVRADHTAVTVTCADPLRVRVAGRRPRICRPPGRTYTLEGRV
jgi:trehalose/maltose hydrolase-like predicted phosphorylase